MTGITTYTQHCNGIPCLCNKLKRFKRSNDWKSKNNFFISNNSLQRKSHRVYRLIIQINQKVYQDLEYKINSEF